MSKSYLTSIREDEFEESGELIFCPKCRRITYAYSVFDDEGVRVGFRCSECYNFFNIKQVDIIPFPNREIILNTTFAEVVAEVDRVDKDELLEKHSEREIAEKFLYALLFLTRPVQPRLYRDRKGRIVWFYAPWDYRGGRRAEEYNDTLLARAKRLLAPAVDENYVVVEIRELDEGDSIFIAVHPDDVERIRQVLEHHRYLLGTS